MNYYTQKNNAGSLNISENVFVQIANDSLSELMKEELKNIVFLKNGNKQAKTHCEIDKKNHIKVDLEVYLSADCEAGKISTEIQKEIYDDIYDATEISAVKVNVIILGFITKK